jgi:hypothetical protein
MVLQLMQIIHVMNVSGLIPVMQQTETVVLLPDEPYRERTPLVHGKILFRGGFSKPEF